MVSASYHNEDSNLTLLTNEEILELQPAKRSEFFFLFVHESNMLSAKWLTLALK